MAHQHVRAIVASFAEQGVQFASDLLGVPRFGTHLAPAHPRTVVGAYACGRGDILLHPDPWGRKIPPSRIQDHGRAALAHAVYVQAVAPHVDHLTGRGIGPLGKLCSDALVDCSEYSEDQKDDDQPQERHPDPPHEPSGRIAAHYAKSMSERGLVLVPKAYSPRCVEGGFSEVRIQPPAYFVVSV